VLLYSVAYQEDVRLSKVRRDKQVLRYDHLAIQYF